MSLAGCEVSVPVSVLEILPEAAGRRGQHFQARGHGFSLYRPTLIRQITMFIYLVSYFSSGELGYEWFCLRNFVIESAYVQSITLS